MKNRTRALVAAFAVACSAAAQAGVVTVWGERYPLDGINSFYDSLADHSSTIAAGTLDTVDLTGVNLLWAVQPADDYTSAEIAKMASFLAGGGRIAFMGEHGTFAPAENTRISAALSALGATITINNVILDAGFRSASVADGQILSHALTTGVSTYEYAAFAPLTLSGTAEALMLGEELFEGNASVMMAYQNIGPGSIFLITDQNVWDNAPAWGSFDNERMFENLLVGNTGAPPVDPPPPGADVPAPGVAGLLGIGLAGLAALRRRRRD